MSSQLRTNIDASQCSILAEAVGEGLHSLAQPLTAALWNLEILTESRTAPASEVSQALNSLTVAVSKLDMVRDLIRPFRSATLFTPASLKQAMATAWQTHRETLEPEGVRLAISEDSTSGDLVVPDSFLERMAAHLMDVLRALGPVTATLQIRETSDQVVLRVQLPEARLTKVRLALAPNVSSLRGYVCVLGGELQTADDDRWLQLKLPKR